MSLSNTVVNAAKIRKGEPITLRGLTFYPIKMSDYEQFLACKDVLLLRMTSLPVKYMAKDYVNALFAMDLDSHKENGTSRGMYERFMRLLYLSLRMEVEDMQKYAGDIVVADIRGELFLKEIKINQSGVEQKIRAGILSSEIRELIAKMNGLELPDENENIALIRDIEERNRMRQKESKVELKYSIPDLISSVAYLSHVSEREINEWTVREFEARRRAIDREKKYMLYGQAEMSGMVTFKNGNPVPSWCYDAEIDEFANNGFEKLGEIFGAKN